MWLGIFRDLSSDSIMKERKMYQTARTAFAKAPLERQMMTVLLVACIIFLSQSEVNGTPLARRKREDNCPRLEVLTSHGCQPCSLCNPEDPNFFELLIRSGCKEKHPDAIAHYGATKLWCDNPYGPFPECPAIPAAVLRNCSSECNKNNRRFAPGCTCRVGCPGDGGSDVVCTRDLQWNNRDSIPARCHPPTTATTTTTTTTVFEGGVTAVTRRDGGSDVGFGSRANTDNKQSAQPTDSLELLWLPVVVAVVSCVAVVVAVLIAVCFWRKRRECPSNSSSSSPKTSDSSPNGSYRTDESLVGPEKCEERLTGQGGTKESQANRQTMAQPSLSQSINTFIDSEPEVEMAGPVEAVAVVPETQALLGRGPEEAMTKGKNWSQTALQALLRSRSGLEKMSLMFDQENQFDKITWHTVAKEFALWDNDEIHKRNYMSRPSLSASPGDGFIYQVLMYLYERTDKGLIELLGYLENRQHVHHREAEKFLRAFLENLEKNCV